MSDKFNFILLYFMFLSFIKVVTPFGNSSSNTCSISNEKILVRGELFLSLLVPSCGEKELSAYESPIETYVATAAWTIAQINNLNLTKTNSLGLKRYDICTKTDFERLTFDTYSEHDNKRSLGLVSFEDMPEGNVAFSKLLNVTITKIEKHWVDLVKASVKVLENLDWKEPITVISETEGVVKEFNKLARRAWMCVSDAFGWRENVEFPIKDGQVAVVILGGRRFIHKILDTKQNATKKLLIVPLDGSKINDLPENAVLIQEPHIDQSNKNTSTSTFTPTPLILDTANIILNFVQSILRGNCTTSTNYTDNCRDTFYKEYIPPLKIIETLKLEDLREFFNYDIYQEKVINNNSSNDTKRDLHKIFAYNIFENSLIDVDVNQTLINSSKHVNVCSTILDECLGGCVNFRDKIIPKSVLGSRLVGDIVLRSESWLFGFISVSVLGIIFALATLIYFIITMFKRVVFEGNPAITILLILSIICIYCSVIPFTIAGGKDSEHLICLYRTLSVSLSYAAAFSLLLSRSIVLATISKEIGYMSHASGPMQSFLCLFIFAVQCALCLQYFNKCLVFFDNLLFLYSLSYVILLLLLFLCVSPLIYQSQRNYREGKHFAISAISMTLAWLCWTLGYFFLGPDWRDPMICLGLVSTGSILIGTILIPRTYMMTVAATRNKITNAFPTLRTSSSIMDIYKASTQPIYDCVNIAAINSNSAQNQNEPRKGSVEEKYFRCISPDNNFEVDSTPTTVQAEKTTKF